MVHRVGDLEPQKIAPEDVFSKLLGHFGKWQLIIFLSVFLIRLPSGWVQMAILFLTPKTVFWCQEVAENFNQTIKNDTCYDKCLKYAYDTSPFENNIISEWDLVCHQAWMASFTQTVLQSGVLIGSIVFGFLSDRYGRKNTFLASIVGLIAFGFSVAFSPNYVIFTMSRFFLGFFVAGTMVISFVIVMESVGPKYREVFGCIFHIPFILGHLTIPLFAYFFRSWDTYSLSLAVPQLIYLSFFLLTTESPRWLVSVGRVEEATEIMKKAAAMNKRPIDKIEDTLMKFSQEVASQSRPKVNYSDLFRPALRVRTLCNCLIWLVTGIAYFGVNQYIGQTSSNVFISVTAAAAVQIPANVLAIWCLRTFGRKVTTFSSFALGGLCILALGVVNDNFWVAFALGTVGISFLTINAATIYIYSSEQYPTVVRNMGTGICSMSMRVGSMVAPFVSNSAIPWLPTAVFGIAPLVGAAVCLLLPETKGRELPDSFEDVEK